jgi:hypothetical protein
VWVSGLEELEADARTLAVYGAAIREASGRGRGLCALYGGFFSVLLSSQGLRGSSHGIGFGEYRRWIELPVSGPPPSRYDLPMLHRYVQQEIAYQLWTLDQTLAGCNCLECQGEPPIALEYHSLMKHSVLCRAAEIQEWTPLDAPAMATRIERDYDRFLTTLDNSSGSPVLRNQADRLTAHLPRWAGALRQLSS